MKQWPEEFHKLMYDLLVTMWDAKMTADWWQFRWLVPIPKQPDQPSFQAMRPIVLLEVTRKRWKGIIITKIMKVIEENNVLCPDQPDTREPSGTQGGSDRHDQSDEASLPNRAPGQAC